MGSTCRIDGCTKPVLVKKDQLCSIHYNRLRRHGDPEAWHRRPRQAACSVEDCGHAVVAGGLCDKHYRRIKRYGSTDLLARPVVCAVAGCEKAVASQALCDRHYRQMRKGMAPGERWCRRCGKQMPIEMHALAAYCSPECKEQAALWWRTETHRKRWLKQYGLTVEQYDAMIEAQGDRCAICQGAERKSNGGVHWCVDHDHTTGMVRGLLCADCNRGIGLLRDDPALLLAAARYLQR